MKRTLCLILTVLVLMSSQSVFAANSKVESVRKSVVRVVAEYDFGMYGTLTSGGSGFLVGEKDGYQYYVTNDHVVTSTKEFTHPTTSARLVGTRKTFGIIYINYYGPESIVKAEIVSQTNGNGIDIAVLKVHSTEQARVPAVLGTAQKLDLSGNVYAIGFPGSSDELLHNRGNDTKLPSAPEDATLTTGTITKTNVSLPYCKAIGIDTVINHGNSGGPLIDDSGKIIGVNTWGLEGNNMAIQIDDVITVLENNGIPYNSKSKGGSDDTDWKSIWLFGGIGVGVLILIIICVLLARGRKPKRKSGGEWQSGNSNKSW